MPFLNYLKHSVHRPRDCRELPSSNALSISPLSWCGSRARRRRPRCRRLCSHRSFFHAHGPGDARNAARRCLTGQR